MGSLVRKKELEKCLQENRLRYFCQPIYDDVKGIFPSGELLLRPNLFGMKAERFVAECVRHGLSGQLDLTVLRHGLNYLEKLVSVPNFKQLNVNLSPRTLEDPQSWESIFLLLRANRDLAEKLCLEVTETETTENFSQCAIILEEVRALGVRLALDDYGAGHSNVNRYIDVPFDMIKLDKSLVDKLGPPRVDMIFRELFNVHFRMGMDTVAEGVETEEQYLRLRSFGFRYFQGYYFSRPIPVEEWLKHPVFSLQRCKKAVV